MLFLFSSSLWFVLCLVGLSALCGVSFRVFVLLPLVGAHVVGGFLAWVGMYAAVSVSSLLLRPPPKKA